MIKIVLLEVKGKSYRANDRPGMMCGGEYWTVNRNEKIKIKDAKMKMLKRMYGVTRPNRIRNEYTKKFMSNTDVA